jgi:hypothetical protein
VKLHEIDVALITAIVETSKTCKPPIKDYKLATSREEREELKKRYEVRQSEIVITDALRHNHERRKSLIANNTAIVLASRRRDNAERLDNLSEETVAKLVSSKISDGEKCLLNDSVPLKKSIKPQTARRSGGAPKR